MNRGMAVFAVVCFSTAIVYAQGKVIKEPAEYKAYIEAVNKPDPAAKAAAMEAFVAQYPNSVVKVDALEQAMAAYQQTANTPKVEQTAERILQIEPASVRALAIVAFLKRAMATANGDAKATQDAGAFARAGLAALPTWPKPEGMSDADFQKLRNQMAAIFYGAAGFADLQAKNFAGARDSYLKSVAIDPANMQDTYQLSIAELQMTPVEVNGFWYAAKAISLAQSQNNPTAANAMAPFAKAMYKRYHGSDDDWDHLVTAAAGQSAPPANFGPSIKARPTPADVACQAVAENDPDTLSFSDWEFILAFRDEGPCNKDAADKVWAALWRKEKQGQAKLRMPVKVISASDRNIEAAITEENQQANKADLKVDLEEPLVKPLNAGAQIDIIGVITGYTPKPFTFFMEKGALPAGQQ
jgi:hypothetical protein